MLLFTNSRCSFQYPPEWVLTETVNDEHFMYLHVDGPKNGLLQILAQPAAIPGGLEDFVRSHIYTEEGLPPAGHLGESEVTRDEIPDWGTVIMNRFLIPVLEQPTPYRQEFRGRAFGNMQVFITMQGPEKHWEMLQRDFAVILESLKRVQS